MYRIYRFKYDLLYFIVTHLVNQHYKICIRRGNGKEVICYIPCTNVAGTTGTTAGNAATAQVILMKVNIYEIKSKTLMENIIHWVLRYLIRNPNMVKHDLHVWLISPSRVMQMILLFWSHSLNEGRIEKLLQLPTYKF